MKSEFWSSFWASPRQIAKQQNAKLNEGADKIVCPHCHEQGHVTIQMLNRKTGISGGKATGAVLTGGLSVAATGLSRKAATRRLTCGNCTMQWDVA